MAYPPTPLALYGPLFVAVQTRRLFADSKTFADAAPTRAPAAILADFHAADLTRDADLLAFVHANFHLPDDGGPPARGVSPRPDILAHIDTLWSTLTRPAPQAIPGASVLAMPGPYVAPGGRFGEAYYWDSYFTLLGLARAGRGDLIAAMIGNFGDQLERFGHIPNGARTYYLGRSQPPVFHLMLGLAPTRDRDILSRRLGWLRIEHGFWMAGEEAVTPGEARGRVVRLSDGAVLNRYCDDAEGPREESYAEDLDLAAATPGRAAGDLWRELRAGCESGWDFSTRWQTPGGGLGSIRATRLVPVDLNSLMFGLETAIADLCAQLGDKAGAQAFGERAAARRTAIGRWLWHEGAGCFADFDLDVARPADAPTAAMAWPLFAGLADDEQARRTAAALEPLVAAGGLMTTLVDSGQQWDAPNGWAPLQWIAVAGLARHGHAALARRIATRWQALVRAVYDRTGAIFEKYDVVRATAGGGGEYPVQDGFGWTNGVYLELAAWLRADAP